MWTVLCFWFFFHTWHNHIWVSSFTKVCLTLSQQSRQIASNCPQNVLGHWDLMSVTSWEMPWWNFLKPGTHSGVLECKAWIHLLIMPTSLTCLMGYYDLVRTFWTEMNATRKALQSAGVEQTKRDERGNSGQFFHNYTRSLTRSTYYIA